MTSRYSQMVPTALVVAVISYCVWPYVLGGWSEHKVGGEKNAIPELTAQLLRPHLKPVPDRDPFQAIGLPSSPTGGVRRLGNASTPSGQAKNSAAATSGSVEGNRGVLGAALSWAGLASTNESSGGSGKSLKLLATSVQGSKRLALIGDRIYQPGEMLQLGTNEGEQQWVVADIRTDRVLLRCDNKIKELRFDEPVKASANQSNNTTPQVTIDDAKAPLGGVLSSPVAGGAATGSSRSSKKSGKEAE